MSPCLETDRSQMRSVRVAQIGLHPFERTTSPAWALPINLVVIAPKEGQNDRQ